MLFRVTIRDKGQITTDTQEWGSWEELVPAYGDSLLQATLVDWSLLYDASIVSDVYAIGNTLTHRLFQKLYANATIQYLTANPTEGLVEFIESQLEQIQAGSTLETEVEVLAAIVLLANDPENAEFLKRLSQQRIAELGNIPRLAKFCLYPLQARLGSYAQWLAMRDEHEES